MDTPPEPRTVAVVVEREDGRWWVCPVAGQDCCRVSAGIGEWAADAIAWHVQTHHRQWR